MSQPSWLQNSLQESHRENVIKVLEYRESYRHAIRWHASDPKRNTLSFHVEPSDQAYYSCCFGKQHVHHNKNRYSALEPYDRTRVLVPDGALTHVQRYLNASWVREAAGGKWWIATQAPLPQTMHAFLTLGICPPISHSDPMAAFPSQRIHTIVQLTTRTDAKHGRSHRYFPRGCLQDMIIHQEHGYSAPPIRVHLEGRKYHQEAHCIVSDLRLSWEIPEENGSKHHDEWQVTHLFYTAWPDFDVPQDNRSIISFAQLIERANSRHLNERSSDPNATPPIMVHCSAGVGRTGSFLALCSLLRAYSLISRPRNPSMDISPSPSLPTSPLGPLPLSLRGDLVAKEIDSLREQRPAMVQKTEQVIWIYSALAEAFDTV